MTVTSTVGTASRNYSTIALWVASIPSTLADNYTALLYADSVFVDDPANFSGHTAGSFTITLTAAPGQSFADQTTIPLRYDNTKGVAIEEAGGNYIGTTINGNDSNVVISRLQLKKTQGYSLVINSSGPNWTVDQCIATVAGSRSNNYVITQSGYTHMRVRNCLIISGNAGTSGQGGAIKMQNSDPTVASLIEFCTLVNYSDSTITNNAIYGNYNTIPVKNCAIYGFSTLTAGAATITFTTCYTDLASPPTGVTQAAYSAQFVGTTAAAADFRQKSGSNLRGTATADSTNGANDIVGTARPTAGLWDVGAWQYVVATTVKNGSFLYF